MPVLAGTVFSAFLLFSLPVHARTPLSLQLLRTTFSSAGVCELVVLRQADEVCYFPRTYSREFFCAPSVGSKLERLIPLSGESRARLSVFPVPQDEVLFLQFNQHHQVSGFAHQNLKEWREGGLNPTRTCVGLGLVTEQVL
jgi:hypothetical protein